MRQRMLKSPAEIALIRQGARIADIGGVACVDALADGVPEYEVALHAPGVMVREIARTFPDAELMDTWTWFQSGINTDGAHNPVTSRRVSKGDILSLNCFPMIAGYYTALERTLFLGHASDAHLRLWEINCQVHRRGLELIRPGARCCDIAAELNEIYRAHGLLDTAPSAMATALACSATTTAARPGSSCARTSRRCWNPAWSSRWSRHHHPRGAAGRRRLP